MGAKHLSVATVIEKNRIASAVAFVPLMEVDIIERVTGGLVETLYMARNSEDVVYQGKTYTAANFDFDITAEAGAAPSLTVTAWDMTRALQARMQYYQGGVGSTVRILVVNTGNMDQAPEISETFQVVSSSTSGYQVSFTLGAENPLTLRFPRRIQYRDRCPWRYKSAECGYAGGLTTCDYTLQGDNGCAAHFNTERFGGFPGLLSQ